jgi:hypothetical protein
MKSPELRLRHRVKHLEDAVGQLSSTQAAIMAGTANPAFIRDGITTKMEVIGVSCLCSEVIQPTRCSCEAGSIEMCRWCLANKTIK